jgi:hypothetical protein
MVSSNYPVNVNALCFHSVLGGKFFQPQFHFVGAGHHKSVGSQGGYDGLLGINHLFLSLLHSRLIFHSHKHLHGIQFAGRLLEINGMERLFGILLQKHFGFLCEWRMIGPFDHRDGVGFDAVYPPEKEIDFDATYEGQSGEVEWTALSTPHEYGIVDIAKQINPYKGAVMYAATEFERATERPVEIRIGTPNAWKLWVNGRLLFAREEYHRGMSLDQYRVAAVLREGTNTILLKICQNEQDEDWAQRYQFQLRVCDEAGAAVR